MKNKFYLVVFTLFFSFLTLAQAAPVDELIAAVIRNSDLALEQALAQRPNVNAQDEKGRTALTLAIHQQSDKVIPLLLQTRGIDLNASNGADESPLMLAILTGQDELAMQLIRRGAAINKKGWAPLHYAATKGSLDMLRLLLDRDAYIDTQSPNNTTPLMMAAQYSGNVEAVAYLLRQGADPWAKNQLGQTALDFAQRSNNEDIINTVQNAQRRRKPEYNVLAAQPLSPASAAELKGLPIPEEFEPPRLIYPEGMEPPEPPPAPASAPVTAPVLPATGVIMPAI